MNRLLLVTSSVFGEASKSRQVALDFVNAWRAAHRGGTLTVRDANSIPHLTAETLGSLMTPAEKRSETQHSAVASADAIIQEVEAADVIVIAAPMYNFSVPSTLKAWIDHLARAGRTFRYTANGPEGLLKNKKVFVVTARGGFYGADSAAKGMDFQEPYLRGVLGFLGLTDVTFIHAEGLAIDAASGAKGMSTARENAAQLVQLHAPNELAA